MAKYGWMTTDAWEDLGNRVGGDEGIRGHLSGSRISVEHDRKVTVSDQANGGISYVSGFDESAFKADWTRHLDEVYGVKVDLSAVRMPKYRLGFGWGVVRVPELSGQRMFEVLTPRFNGKTWKWCVNIDEVLDPEKEARTTVSGPYVVLCRDRVEADEEHKNKSANDLVAGINCMTEPERIALEGWFHWKTSGHLDIKNVTLSVGSRWRDGSVPGAFWYGSGGFCVRRYNADDSSPGVRAREVVS